VRAGCVARTERSAPFAEWLDRATLAIGGAKADQLFITTARQPVALDTLANAPLSGRLLVAPI